MTDEEYLKMLYFENLYDFSNEDDCEHLREINKNMVLDEKPMFSFMMCVYNDTRLLNTAINSLLKQSFKQWELVILDNSDDNNQAWEMIENAMGTDRRIRGFRSDKNVGWPKGASICLKYVKGTYTTFLSADDCINLESLARMNDVLSREKPDILWVGNAYVNLQNDNSIALEGVSVPKEYEVIYTDNRSDTIVKIMQDIYYNSFFHYMRVDFLKQNNIDFFEPFYADCGGMTKAMAIAKKMVVYNDIVYFLTLNTSQTVGRYSWDSYEYIFVNQWNSVKEVFLKEKYNNFEGIQYVAIRILNNLFGNIESLCQGNCRDKYMNKIEKSLDDIIHQLEKIFMRKEILEMLVYAGVQCIDVLLNNLKTLKMWNINCESRLIKNSYLRALLENALQDKDVSFDEKIKLYSVLIGNMK